MAWRDEKQDQAGASLGSIAAVVGGCAAVIGFWFSYGLPAIGAILAIASWLALYQVQHGEPFLVWATRERKTRVVFGIRLLLALSVVVAVLGVFFTKHWLDLFRPEIAAGPIQSSAYRGSSAPWNIAPGPGASEGVGAAFAIAGWKRLMASALVNDPENAANVTRQLYYVESAAFDRDYQSFTAELEFPTSIHVSEAYAFLSLDSDLGADRQHEQLQSLRADSFGVDGNRSRIMVRSPRRGERVVVFAVANARDKAKPFPKDIESSIVLRSIR